MLSTPTSGRISKVVGIASSGQWLRPTALALYLIGTAVYARRRRTGVERYLEEANPALAEQHGQQGLVALLLAICVFFFVPWSGNFLFALWLSPGIRSWDRLLPIILLLVLVGAVQVSRQLGWGRHKRPLLVATVLISVVMLLDEVAPYPSVVRAALDSGRDIRDDGESYAASINREVPRHCGVLQLPYVPFPGEGRTDRDDGRLPAFPCGTDQSRQGLVIRCGEVHAGRRAGPSGSVTG